MSFWQALISIYPNHPGGRDVLQKNVPSSTNKKFLVRGMGVWWKGEPLFPKMGSPVHQ